MRAEAANRSAAAAHGGPSATVPPPRVGAGGVRRFGEYGYVYTGFVNIKVVTSVKLDATML